MNFNNFAAIISILLFAITFAGDVPKGINTFANKLFHLLPDKSDNLIFSPLSVHAVLSLAYQGAAGQTADDLRKALNLPEASVNAEEYKNLMGDLNASTNITLLIANKIYVKSEYKIKSNYATAAKTYFAADAQGIDFSKATEAASEMNAWIEQKTNDKIHDLISPDALDSNTAIILLNAIYFKGDWIALFDAQNTKVEKFHTSETETTDCRMMHQTNKFDYADSAELDAQMLRMKYEDERFSMIIVLPKSKTGVEELERKLANVDVATLTKPGRIAREKVQVSIPKFKFEKSLELNEPLMKIGLTKMFYAAELPHIIESAPGLRVDKVVQKAFIEVDEKGSTAAAASGVVGAFFSAEPLPKVFTADHPFIFYITAALGYGNTADTILFMGRITAPSIS